MTSTQNNALHGKLRIAGMIIVAGLATEGLSLLWTHPLSFLAFLCIGGLLLVAGIALYLFALIST